MARISDRLTIDPLKAHSDVNVEDEEHNHATIKRWKLYDTSLENVGPVRMTRFAHNNNPMIDRIISHANPTTSGKQRTILPQSDTVENCIDNTPH